jgi:HK97 family phage major capsid protein
MTIARLAGLLFGRLDPLVAVELIRCWNEVRCRPPLADAELKRTLDSIAARENARDRAGARSIPISGATSFATIDEDPTSEWKAENAAIVEETVTLGSRLFVPQTLAVLVKSSIELIEDAPNAEALIRESIANALALQLDKMCLVGDGVGKPLGICGTPGVGQVAVNAALTSYAPLSKAVEKVQTANGEPGDFILSARTSGEIDRLTDNDGNPLRPPRSVSERRLLVTNQVPTDLVIGSPALTNASAIFVGQLDRLYIAIRTNLVLEATRMGGDSFKNLEVWIRGYLRADVFAVRPDHFAVCTGITSPS